MTRPAPPPPPERPFLETPDVETASDDYATRFAGAVGAWFLERQTRITLELLAPWPGASVLDVGGGHAQLAVPLVERGFAVTVTGSTPACRARLDTRLAEGSFGFDVADVLRLPYEDTSFDVVIAFRLLPHVERWPRLVAELCRVARHAVIVDYPDRRSVNAVAEPLFGLKARVERNTRTYLVFRRRRLLDAFREAGFTNPVARPQFLLPMAAHRAVGRAPVSRAVERVLAATGLTTVLGSPVILRVERGQATANDVERA